MSMMSHLVYAYPAPPTLLRRYAIDSYDAYVHVYILPLAPPITFFFVFDRCKMPWPFFIPEFLKRRACRYLLHHYLGQYLEGKIRLEDLTIDLYNGTGSVGNIPLNVEVCRYHFMCIKF